MTWRPLDRLLPLVLGGVVATALLAAPASGRTAGAPPSPAMVTASGVVEHVLSSEGVLDYWTPARMRAARPLDLDPSGRLVRGDAPARTTSARALTSPSTAGKLFFSTSAGDAVCSASTVNTARRDLIITAGHCVHSGPTGGLLPLFGAPEAYTNFLFVPRYTNGSAPHGRWVGLRSWTFPAWTERGNPTYDQGLIRLAPRNGRRIVNVVGGNGVAWGYPPREDGVRVWGWPAESPYDGETAHRCAGPTTSFQGSGDAKISCRMTGGSSGGPWFLSMVSRNVGFVWAVTSRRTITGPPYLIAHPLPREIRGLLATTDRAAARSAGTTQPTSSRTAYRSRLVLRALDPVVGRGQAGRLRARTAPQTRVVLDVRFRRDAPWRRAVHVGRTNGEGVVVFSIRMVRPGLRWYRARARTGRTDPVRIRVRRCPLPLDERRAVVDATGCTAPSV